MSPRKQAEEIVRRLATLSASERALRGLVTRYASVLMAEDRAVSEALLDARLGKPDPLWKYRSRHARFGERNDHK